MRKGGSNLNHSDHLDLIRGGIADPSGVWADFGSGEGAFTLALADLLGSDALIHSIDRDARALDHLRAAISARFPAVNVTYHPADFTRPLDLPLLDGALMANSLHFVKDKPAVLRLIHGYLKPGGRLIMVEYNTDSGNMWVPYPFSFSTWAKLAAASDFVETRQLFVRPSRFLGEIYSAVSLRP
jgi:SAM-dependent methyltransferase